MQTQLIEAYQVSERGREAEAIIRRCVHCGFCNATCPTYQLLGDELDGPRGRIYLIKQLLEGEVVTEKTQLHLDRCLSCQSCETTCPSGVNYHRLLDIGRELVDEKVTRTLPAKAFRRLLAGVLSRRRLFTTLLRCGQTLRPALPAKLKALVPVPQQALIEDPSPSSIKRQVLLLEGCVQPGLSPNINIATKNVLTRLGIGVQTHPKAGCCGALKFHLDELAGARQNAKANIDAWWPAVETGVEALIITASGCGVFVKDYATLLANDPIYRDKAKTIAALALDISEFLSQQDLQKDLQALLPSTPSKHAKNTKKQRVAFHAPCTLQHGQKLSGVVEALLTQMGFELVAVADTHLCCGSAGTYSILQSEISTQLREQKVKALEQNAPDFIASANIGCLSHLSGASDTPIRHWVELVHDALTAH